MRRQPLGLDQIFGMCKPVISHDAPPHIDCARLSMTKSARAATGSFGTMTVR
jgi:hypothetical protein